LLETLPRRHSTSFFKCPECNNEYEVVVTRYNGQSNITRHSKIFIIIKAQSNGRLARSTEKYWPS